MEKGKGRGRGRGRGRARGRGYGADNPSGHVGKGSGLHQQPQQQQQSQQQQQQQQQASPQQQQQQHGRSQQQQQQQQARPQQQQQQQQQQQSRPQQPPEQQQNQQKPPQQKSEQPKPKVTTLAKKEFPLPLRPSIGTQGRKVQLITNFFPLKIPPNMVIYQYDVTIKEGPKVDEFPKAKGRLIIEQLVDENRAVFCKRPVYNGKKIMYTKEGLDFEGSKSFTVEYNEDGRKRKFEITIKWTALVEMKTLQDVIFGKVRSLPQDLINGLDIVLRHAATLRYVPIGSKFFTNTGAVNLGGGRDMWPGFHVSVRPTDRWKLMLNIDVSATAFIRPVAAIEYLYDVTGYDCTKPNTNKLLTDFQRRRFAKEIKGLKIAAIHLPTKRKYRVNDVKIVSAEKETFKKENGEMISVKDYFANDKNRPLKYPWLPCLHVGSKTRNICLPLEVCHIVQGQKCPRKLNDDQTANMIKQTARRPHERKKIIETIVNKDLNFGANQYTKDFGFQVDNRMTHVEGRVLAPPEILYAGSSSTLTPSGGAWNMRGIRVFIGATIKAWGFVILNEGRRSLYDDAAEKFVIELVKMAKSMGITMGTPAYRRSITERDRPEDIVSQAFEMNKNLDLLVVALPGKTPFYANLKRLCETEVGYQKIKKENHMKTLKERGLSTQCIQHKNAAKCNAMCLAQLCLKINAKMGGVNNAIHSRNQVTRPIRVFNPVEPVMFMGADVTHPGSGDKSSPSIAAIVGSVDEYPSRYAVCVRVQTHRVEIIEEMKIVTVELLKQFNRATKKKPCKIVMYRDGVSEGQFQQVLLYEMQAIQEACKSLEKNYQPAITFIVVQKRHHARFFNQQREDSDRSGNCQPGTTIDTGICHPTEYDYYQFGHSGIQGTSRPAHYHVLHDDSDFTPDELQALSFMLCHLYARCTRSVSVPAPAYYAHHVAFRAIDHLREHVNDDTASSSGRSDASDVAEQLARLNLYATVVKPHPRLMNQMYFV